MTGKSEMEIIPDLIYLKIFLNEKDNKSKLSRKKPLPLSVRGNGSSHIKICLAYEIRVLLANPHKNNSAIKKCAFCSYWYDPMNSAIKPKAASIGYWEFDPSAKSVCLEKNVEIKSFQCCYRFKCKI